MQSAGPQEDLAGKLAAQSILLDRTTISRIETSSRYFMDYELIAIPKSLKVSVATLCGEGSRQAMTDPKDTTRTQLRAGLSLAI
jgi:hypothetical protein